ncbi:zingipain-2-like [Aegilops tauschii subsp. strangulata]|uniref:Vignain n=1 Tax=Aegilops tauschii TaxID=37682 RepID=N1QUX2_AEGTA
MPPSFKQPMANLIHRRDLAGSTTGHMHANEAAPFRRWRLAVTSQQAHLGDGAAATAGHRFGFSRSSSLKPHATAIAGWSTAGAAFWYMKSLPSEINWLKANVVPSDHWVAEVDWVEAGAVSPVVRKQNGCGECPELSHCHCLYKSSLTDTKSSGCNGGQAKKAFRYMQDNGVSSESSYPYKARGSKLGCERNKTATAVRISGFQFVNPTEGALEKAVAKQPVVVSLQCPDDMDRYYKEGILDYKVVKPATLHSVLIVGYGTDSNDVKYWRFKNSWGPDWGEGGFGRIRRHVGYKGGALGIFMRQGVYPVVEN